MYKNIFKICIIIIFCIFFSSCSFNETDNDNEKLTIVTTIFPAYDFIKQIAGDKVDVKMLLSPGEEVHNYDPTPQDIIDIQNADLFIYTGGENDVWVNNILSSINKQDEDILSLLSCVPPLFEEIIEGMEDYENDDEHDDDYDNHEAYDEHVWTYPLNAVYIVEKLTEILCQKDSTNESFYKQNSANYINELKDLDNQYINVISNAKRNVILFADRFPFRYLAYYYGLDYYAAFSGCSEETEASPKTIAFLIEKVKENSLPVILITEFSDGKISDAITESVDVKVLTLHSAHNITKEEYENNETYLSIMQKNLAVLEEALN